MGKTLELSIGFLNGAIGDHLARTDNGLATKMTLVHEGLPLAMTKSELARAYPEATGRVALLVHGLMCTEAIWELPDGSDYGSMLTRDLGFTPLYVRYNSGLPIPDNGEHLAALLAELVEHYPVPIEQLLPIGYSMGGLVVRSACHAAVAQNHGWLSLVKRAIYVGTPHQGAPLERLGRVIARVLRAVDDPYTRLFADLADLRSDGVKDLGDADLRHDDRARRVARVTIRDARHPVPLLPQIQHYLVAASLSDDLRIASLFGDAMVPVPSATDGGCIDAATFAIPPSHVTLFRGMNHVTLAHHPGVYERIRAWCEAAA